MSRDDPVSLVAFLAHEGGEGYMQPLASKALPPACLCAWTLNLIQNLSCQLGCWQCVDDMLIFAHSSYGEGDHCPLRLSGLPAAHTFYWVNPQSPHLISPFTQWNAIGPHRHLVGCPQARNVNHCIVLLQDKLHTRIQSKKSCLRRNSFPKFCPRRNIFIKKSCLRRIFFHKNFLLCAQFSWNQMFGDFYHSGENKSTQGRPTINQSIN